MRTAIVTGGAGGIGSAVARHLAGTGWQVAVFDVDEEGRRRVEGAHEAIASFDCDVADEPAVAAAAAAVVDRFGSVDGLVTCAGLPSPSGPHVSELPRERWDRVLAVNLTGTMLAVKHAAPHLRASRGSIVTIASTRAHQSEPDGEAYAASKGGVVALTRALAVSLGPHVRVNCVSPGWIHTSRGALRPVDHEQHPAGRVGRPADVASLVGWLLSPEAGFVTGTELVADGGMSIRMHYED